MTAQAGDQSVVFALMARTQVQGWANTGHFPPAAANTYQHPHFQGLPMDHLTTMLYGANVT